MEISDLWHYQYRRILHRRLVDEDRDFRKGLAGGSAPASPQIPPRDRKPREHLPPPRKESTGTLDRKKAIKKRPRTTEVGEEASATLRLQSTYSRSSSTPNVQLPPLPPLAKSKTPSPKPKRAARSPVVSPYFVVEEEEVVDGGGLRQRVDLTNLEFASEGRRRTRSD